MYGKGNFKKVLDFVKELTRSFDVSKEGTHVGIVLYSSKAEVGLPPSSLFKPLISLLIRQSKVFTYPSNSSSACPLQYTGAYFNLSSS